MNTYYFFFFNIANNTISLNTNKKKYYYYPQILYLIQWNNPRNAATLPLFLLITITSTLASTSLV